MRNKTMVMDPKLSALWEQAPGPDRWLVLFSSVNLKVSVIGGPYRTRKQLMVGLTSFLRSGDYEGDTIHIRTFDPKVAEALGVQQPVHGVRQAARRPSPLGGSRQGRLYQCMTSPKGVRQSGLGRKRGR